MCDERRSIRAAVTQGRLRDVSRRGRRGDGGGKPAGPPQARFGDRFERGPRRRFLQDGGDRRYRFCFGPQEARKVRCDLLKLGGLLVTRRLPCPSLRRVLVGASVLKDLAYLGVHLSRQPGRSGDRPGDPGRRLPLTHLDILARQQRPASLLQ